MNELKIVKFFNSRFPYFDGAVKLVSYRSSMIIFLSFLTILFWIIDRENGSKVLLSAALAAIFFFVFNEGLIKRVLPWRRKRPYLNYPGEITQIGYRYEDSSFPSSHVASGCAIFTVFFYFYPAWWPLMGIFLLFLMWSRLRSGMHYPSDILAGVVLGIIYGLAAVFLIN